MKIIYVSTLCSNKKFKELFDLCTIKPVQQGQKYTNLLVTGIAKNDTEIIVLSVYPINNRNTKKKFFKNDEELIDSIKYLYIGFANIKYIKNIMIFIKAQIMLIQLLSKNEKTIVIIDGLNITLSLAAIIVCKFKMKDVYSTITDIPLYMHKMENNKNILIFIRNKFINKIFNIIIDNSRGFIFLTKYMNEIKKNINQKSIIIEGIVDDNMRNKSIDIHDKYDKKICLYTGALNEIYGIKLLTEAFVNANVKNSEMHFYGDGDCSSYLRELAIQHPSIKYFGVVSNDIIVQEQMKATILINPRPSDEEYTKYSFPSKNMEYMASGTPVLTTNLPGMPEEYLKYVYLIKNETIEGISYNLSMLLSKSSIELHEKGQEAREFVLGEKNNIIQGLRVINMIKDNTKKSQYKISKTKSRKKSI